MAFGRKQRWEWADCNLCQCRGKVKADNPKDGEPDFVRCPACKGKGQVRVPKSD